MDNTFEILLTYNAKVITFPAEYINTGYSYRINVDVYGQIIAFEPDEERNFRAVLSYDHIPETGKVDKALVEQIGHQLIIMFKEN
jgi:hypothetical protein